MLTLLMASLLIGSQTKVAPYKHKIQTNFVVTAYAPHDLGVGKITSTGHRVKRGTIAVDPRYIPYGSKIYVPGYGWGVADDCGGAIKRKHIDVYLSSRHSASRWGRKFLNIIVITKKKSRLFR